MEITKEFSETQKSDSASVKEKKKRKLKENMVFSVMMMTIMLE